MNPLSAIKQPLPLAKLAYESLRDSILSGRLEPGAIYNERALADQLGISKTPVREALLELAAQGLVTFLPRRGVMVNRFSERDIQEVFEVRLAIELAMAEKLARKAPAVDLGRVEDALREQERAIASEDPEAFVEADRRFHVVFGELVDNRRLAAILENVRDLIHVMGREALLAGARPEEVVAEHRRIVDVLRSGDPDAARRAMEEHICRTRDRVLEHFRRNPRPS
ncbi:MAG: GntR family transcriptional regulator [Deferrisomatales bacterium]